MSTDSLRNALLARRAEIEAALNDLDRIEALAGMVVPSPSAEAAQTTHKPREKSNSQLVVEVIAKGPRSIPELSAQLGLTESQVYHALTSHRLRRITGTVVVDGEKKYALKSWIHSGDTYDEPPHHTLTESILDLLEYQHGEPMQTSAIANALLGKVETTATNFRGTVASTLSALVKSGRIRRIPGRGYATTQGLMFE